MCSISMPAWWGQGDTCITCETFALLLYLLQQSIRNQIYLYLVSDLLSHPLLLEVLNPRRRIGPIQRISHTAGGLTCRHAQAPNAQLHVAITQAISFSGKKQKKEAGLGVGGCWDPKRNNGVGPTFTTGLHPNGEPNDRGLAHAGPLAATYSVPDIIPFGGARSPPQQGEKTDILSHSHVAPSAWLNGSAKADWLSLYFIFP